MGRDRAKLPRISTLLPFPLSEHGGVSTFVAGLSDAIERNFGVQHLLIAPERFLGRSGQRLSQARLAGREFVRLHRWGPDVVHTHQHPVLLASALAYRATARRRVRVVHGWLLGRCDFVTAVSKQTARDLGRVASPPPTSVHIIPGATNIQPRSAQDHDVVRFRTDFGLESASPILCQVSPLNFPRKVLGVEHLIRAFAIVRQCYPAAQLLVVGDGLHRAQVVATAAQVGLAHAVHVTGYIDDVSIPLALADVYCHISLQDACPLSLLEAMRCGKPIVAARIDGIAEILTDGDDGLLVDPMPAQVAEAILRLIDEPELAARLGLAALQTAVNRFTWDRAAADFAPLYGLPGREATGVQSAVQ
jgi:L-malate glycosyltransferase